MSVINNTKCMRAAAGISGVLSPVFCLHRAKEVYEFAYTYPYSYTELQKWLFSWDRLQLPYLQRLLLCRTPQLKRVDALVIQESYVDVGQSYMLHPTCTITAHACCSCNTLLTKQVG